MTGIYLFEFFHELRDPAQRTDAAAIKRHFDWYLDLWTNAEAAGWDGIFFSEHHFGSAYSPSPNLLVAAMSQRTSRMRLGVLGTVLPYATPWRVVEEFAMLEKLCGGRFDPGVVSGIPPELAAAGVSPDAAAQRYADIVRVLMDSLGGKPVSLASEEFQFTNLPLVPTFNQQHPRIWTAAKSVSSARRAGQMGMRLCAGFLSVEEVADLFNAYRLAAPNSKPEDLAIRRFVTFDDNQRVARNKGKQALLATLKAGIAPLPPFATILDRPDQPQVDATGGLSDDEFVGGTPAEVASQLRDQCERTGAGNVLVSFGSTGYPELLRDHSLFANEVIPLLRER